MTALDRALSKAYQWQAESRQQLAAAEPILRAVGEGTAFMPLGTPAAPLSAVGIPRANIPQWTWPPLCEELLAQTAQGFSQLAEYLLQGASCRGMKTVALNSLERGAGTSSVLLTLALLMSRQSNAKVLLVDADFESPDLGQQLGLLNVAGLWEVVEGRAALPQVLERLTSGSISILPLTRPVKQADLSQEECRLRQLLQQVREHFDLVLVDAGPLNPAQAAERLWLQGGVDAIVTISSARKRANRIRIDSELHDWRRAGLESLGVIETFA